MANKCYLSSLTWNWKRWWSIRPLYRASAKLRRILGEEDVRINAINLLDLQPGQVVLDLSCGLGTNVSLLHRHQQSDIFVTDENPEMVEAARAEIRDHNFQGVRAVNWTYKGLPLADASVDAVVCTLGLTNSQFPEMVMYEALRVLKPNGKMSIVDYVSAYGDAALYSVFTWPLYTLNGSVPNDQWLGLVISNLDVHYQTRLQGGLSNLFYGTKLPGRPLQQPTILRQRLAAHELSLQQAAQRKAQEEAQRVEAERKAQEEAQRAEAERKAQEEAQRAEAERKAQEEAQRAEAERKAQEEAQRAEAERKAQEEEAQRAEAERKAQEEAQRAEAERKAQEEEAQRAEAERKAQEEAQRAEAERKAQEEAQRAEAERKAQEEAQRAEAERKAQEEAQRAEEERKAQEKAARADFDKKAMAVSKQLQEDLVARKNENASRSSSPFGRGAKVADNAAGHTQRLMINPGANQNVSPAPALQKGMFKPSKNASTPTNPEASPLRWQGDNKNEGQHNKKRNHQK